MPSFLPLLSLILLCFPLISSSTISIPLSVLKTPSSKHQDPYQKLAQLASVSLARAHHIKNPKTSTPVSPHSYGAYSISLKFGTPPQTIPFILDTGSSFVWFPCTHRYVCKNCSATANGEAGIAAFIPKSSSSVKILGCMNPKCAWIHNQADPLARCKDCQQQNGKNCTQICPPYILLYGSGTTSGITLVETLDLPHKKVPNFVVGCSLFSSHQPAGIAGFGRGFSSLPSQLGLKKFSYCLLSRRYDDTGKTSTLVLDSDSDSDKKSANLSYTPLVKNPVVRSGSALSVYYYVGLRKITVGGQKVKIPYKHLIPGENGDGGSIVDSGTTFTFMSSDVFKPVLSAFVKQVKAYERAERIESQTGLRPCFNVSGHERVSLPEMELHFKGGAKMALPLANYFFVLDGEVVCFAMVTSNFYGPQLSGGPSIILGNFQMQNFHVEYDLRNQRFGFRQQLCS